MSRTCWICSWIIAFTRLLIEDGGGCAASEIVAALRMLPTASTGSTAPDGDNTSCVTRITGTRSGVKSPSSFAFTRVLRSAAGVSEIDPFGSGAGRQQQAVRTVDRFCELATEGLAGLEREGLCDLQTKRNLCWNGERWNMDPDPPPQMRRQPESAPTRRTKKKSQQAETSATRRCARQPRFANDCLRFMAFPAR